jgi:hypothetical protein
LDRAAWIASIVSNSGSDVQEGLHIASSQDLQLIVVLIVSGYLSFVVHERANVNGRRTDKSLTIMVIRMLALFKYES